MLVSSKVFTVVTFVFLFSLCSCNRESNQSTPTQTNPSQVDEKSPQFSQIETLALQGNPEAQYHVGMMYNNGLGVRKNPKEAFKWFEKATDSGDALAAFKLGCYYNGQFPGVVPIDRAKSLEYTLIAATAGYSLAQSEAGNAYFVQGNTGEGIKWWKLAAEQGYPEALYNLSATYGEGKVIPRNNELSYSYFKISKLMSEKQITTNAKATLDELASKMTSEELNRAEQIVSKWKAKPTPLTQKAANGVGEAEKLIKDSGHKN